MKKKRIVLAIFAALALACATLVSGVLAGGGMGGGGMGGPGRGAQAGPPAPVPPEVAIPRPSADELARINAALKRFIDTDTSADKELFTKFPNAITVAAPRANACILPAPSARGNRHNQLLNIANTGDFDIMFLGDSITELLGNEKDAMGNPGGKPIVDKYFSDVKYANFGVAGDTTQGILWGLQNGEGQGHKPKAVMLMIGANNVGGATGAEIAEGIGADVIELRKDFPDAKILLVAVFPQGARPTDANRLKVEEANKIIAKLDDQKHVFFLNLNSKFINENGGLIGFRPSDNLHPVTEGFEIWISSVAPILKSWVK
jgi:lysophospholipase L1-like esterase